MSASRTGVSASPRWRDRLVADLTVEQLERWLGELARGAAHKRPRGEERRHRASPRTAAAPNCLGQRKAEGRVVDLKKAGHGSSWS
jgi:hypothetical protein